LNIKNVTPKVPDVKEIKFYDAPSDFPAKSITLIGNETLKAMPT